MSAATTTSSPATLSTARPASAGSHFSSKPKGLAKSQIHGEQGWASANIDWNGCVPGGGR